MDLLYLNVYAVTRHYGGPEEGGWWYNAGEARASVPIKAKRERGHSDSCRNCWMVRHNESDSGEKREFCKVVPEDFDYRVDVGVEDRAREQGKVYHQLTSEERAALEAAESEALMASYPEEYHLVPEDAQACEAKKKELEEMFADIKEGNIYSVLGGTELQVSLEEHPARDWPERKPHYE